MLSRVLILVAVTYVALAAVARQQLDEKPEEYKDCDGCWIKDIQQFVPINQSFPSPTKCEQYNCRATEVTIYSCGALGYPKELLTVDESLPYPGCCPQPISTTEEQEFQN